MLEFASILMNIKNKKKFNILDFKQKYIMDQLQCPSYEENIQVKYTIENKATNIKIKMKEGLQYLSIGHTIANGIMLPHLDLFGNNFSFFQEKKGD